MKDKIYKYNGSGNLYKVIQEALMKNPQTRNWDECVIYRSYKNLCENGTYISVPEDDILVFVREKSEFLTKFEEVNE